MSGWATGYCMVYFTKYIIIEHWFFGSLVILLFGYLVLWLFGYLVLWFFGSLILEFFSSLVKSKSKVKYHLFRDLCSGTCTIDTHNAMSKKTTKKTTRDMPT